MKLLLLIPLLTVFSVAGQNERKGSVRFYASAEVKSVNGDTPEQHYRYDGNWGSGWNVTLNNEEYHYNETWNVLMKEGDTLFLTTRIIDDLDIWTFSYPDINSNSTTLTHRHHEVENGWLRTYYETAIAREEGILTIESMTPIEIHIQFLETNDLTESQVQESYVAQIHGTNLVQLYGSELTGELTIINSLGQQIMKEVIHSNEPLSLDHLQRGTYYLLVQDDLNTFRGKCVIR